ncbi:hypothetical protein VFA_004118 [Vibrio furnissii CIP 102972]|nr:hypothetical protein vfu_A00308 [Vibrio furnissii NCTC 11218]EEX39132.1 hypothetical protein VFA_004118 [Vibrio furnissii CIP 102972]SUP42423.1 Uncharacterised protein [Vibrio furnissii]
MSKQMQKKPQMTLKEKRRQKQEKAQENGVIKLRKSRG